MKRRLTGYTFDASAQTVTHADFSDVTLAGIQLITNVTDQVIIYNFADTAKGGTLSTDTLTLEHDTTSMSDTDELMILVDDAVVAQTISGTVTANLSATDNQVLDDIKVDTEAIETAVEAIQAGQLADGHNVTIDNAAGAAAVNIQDGGNTITVDGTVAVTNAGLTEVAAAINASSQMDVNIAASGATVPVSHTALTELAAAINSNLVDVNIVSGAGSGGTAAADDADFTAGTTNGTPAMGVYESTPTSVTDGDLGTVGITSDRKLKVQADLGAVDNAVLDNIETATEATQAALETAGGLVVNLGANNDVTVTGSVTANAGTNLNTSALALESGGNLDSIQSSTAAIMTAVEIIDNAVATEGSALGSGVLLQGDDGTDRTNVLVDTSGHLQVDVLTMPTVTVDLGANNDVTVTSGAITETNSGGIQTAVQLIDDAIYIDDADWTADTSKHMLAGAVTQVATTANTDGDTTPLTTNAMRELRVAYPESDLATAGTAHVHKPFSYTGAQTDAIIWSPAAGKRFYITDYGFVVSAAATVTFEDDRSGGDVNLGMGGSFAANSGKESPGHGTPIFSGEDAADLILTTSAGNIEGYVTGYEV